MKFRSQFSDGTSALDSESRSILSFATKDFNFVWEMFVLYLLDDTDLSLDECSSSKRSAENQARVGRNVLVGERRLHV